MQQHRLTALVTALLVVGSLLAVPTGSASPAHAQDPASGPLQQSLSTTAPDRVTIDADHRLASEQAIERFEANGTVSANLSRLDLTLTIAEEHQDAGVEGYYADVNRVWIRVEYDEAISRTVRIYIPSAYFRPRVASDEQAVNGEQRADFVPTKNRSYTALTITLDGKTDATFALSVGRGLLSGVRSDGKTWVENATDISLPSLSPTAAGWQYLDGTDLAGENVTATLPQPTGKQELTVQYDEAEGDEEAWVPVPQCEDRLEPVCTVEKANRTVVVSSVDRPPTVRYRVAKPSMLVDIQGGIEELTQIPGRIVSDVQETIGGLF